jgi:hypothetical protein
MPTLVLGFKKRPDADPLLVLTREDGSFTSGRIVPGYGPVHDMAHYVAEHTLGLCAGFLGLVASGWEIGDFEVKGTARRLPDDAMLAESVAGALSAEEMMQQFSSAEDFTWGVQAVLSDNMKRDPVEQAGLTAESLAAMRAELGELHLRWRALPPGGTLELQFNAPRAAGMQRPAQAPLRGRER